MGFDCTYHLVDEGRLREVFVQKLLGQSDEKTPFDIQDDAPEIWANARQSLCEAIAKDRPEVAAGIVCELALRFTAAERPCHYERGIALGTWDMLDDYVSGTLPGSLKGDPEELFANLVETQPNLRGHFPREFTGNYSTGVYVPARSVKDALEWVRSQTAGIDRSDQQLFHGLICTLQAAANHGYGYWEATDLGVTIPCDAEEKLHALAGMPYGPQAIASGPLEIIPLPGDRMTHYSVRAAHKSIVLASDRGARLNSIFMDLDATPLRIRHLQGQFVVDACPLSDGRWVVLSAGEGDRMYRCCIYDDLFNSAEPLILPPIRIGSDGAEVRCVAVGAVGDSFCVFPYMDDSDVRELASVPLLFSNGAYIPAPGIPSVEWGSVNNKYGIYIGRKFRKGCMHLNDGTDVVVWDSVAYDWRDASFEAVGNLGVSSELELTYAPTGKDGCFFIRERCLFEMHFSEPSEKRHLERFSTIMAIAPGPAGSLLLTEFVNKRGNVGMVYFPDEDAVIYLEPELFGETDRTELAGPILYSKGGNCLLMLGEGIRGGMHAACVPLEHVLSLPRYRGKTGRRIKGTS